ncbi:MAG: ribosome-associated translation inhibitor RaiA [Deltaproteobacteria bacterium]|nr:ribosome-associated translation inhibitor RaiA [bacterium]MCB9477430.1 ribosome-associated translation inhibitor RaiA [Deltaproteobacteria bacterium]MCB9478788.1 ribosome-associated translation inhibitor RaiA [Deltaproteobacteria bacterium]MCB9489050.1 ribosome-associated translation inhibitor RaiA [Deltaproteobacteria bacterium]
MNISVTFRNSEPSDALRTYAEEKLAKVKKYLHEPIDMHVVLAVEKFRHHAEVTLTADQHVINCKEQTEDMYSAVDKLVGTLERQIKKAKGRGNHHKGDMDTASAAKELGG